MASESAVFWGFGGLIGGDGKAVSEATEITANLKRGKVTFGPGQVASKRRIASFSLSAKLHQSHLYLPVKDYPLCRVEILGDGFSARLALPSAKDIWVKFGEEAMAKLDAKGTLVIPHSWRKLEELSLALQPWEKNGWTLSHLGTDEDKEQRFIHIDNGLMTLDERSKPFCIPANPTAAHGWALATQVVAEMVSDSEDAAKEAWKDSEEQRQGWFAHQQVAFRIMDAIRDGNDHLELGGKDYPVFVKPAAAACEGLPRIMVKVTLPPLLSSGEWWSLVEKSRTLKHPAHKKARAFGVKWARGDNIILASDDDNGGLKLFLETNGHRCHIQDATTSQASLVPPFPLSDLEDTVTAKPPPPPRPEKPPPPPPPTKPTKQTKQTKPPPPTTKQEASPPEDVAKEPEVLSPPETKAPVIQQRRGPGTPSQEPAEEPSPAPPASAQGDDAPLHKGGLINFSLGGFTLDIPHRQDVGSMTITVDGKPLENLSDRLERRGGRGSKSKTYGLSGDFRHGSVMRIDYETLGDDA